ncbi:uncharacterized protein PSANT_01279 [Moesziomyces antarcticus]|uniref:Uncharacterized protein n=1 Tax=Pseudozyma antarctica TaxID=84753 RepID=A0A5C3FGQ7_PSEA2|nr:uncharacterized protein PSANT_01279 [Moesziomyces antarcticus]
MANDGSTSTWPTSQAIAGRGRAKLSDGLPRAPPDRSLHGDEASEIGHHSPGIQDCRPRANGGGDDGSSKFSDPASNGGRHVGEWETERLCNLVEGKQKVGFGKKSMFRRSEPSGLCSGGAGGSL